MCVCVYHCTKYVLGLGGGRRGGVQYSKSSLHHTPSHPHTLPSRPLPPNSTRYNTNNPIILIAVYLCSLRSWGSTHVQTGMMWLDIQGERWDHRHCLLTCDITILSVLHDPFVKGCQFWTFSEHPTIGAELESTAVWVPWHFLKWCNLNIPDG